MPKGLKRSISRGPVDYSSADGFEDQNNTQPAVELSPGVWTSLPNDGAGAFTNVKYRPRYMRGESGLFTPDAVAGTINPNGLSLGEAILIRNDFEITPTVNGAYVEFRYTLGAGGSAYTLPKPLGALSNGAGVGYRFQFTDYIYMGDENTRDNPIGLQVRSSEIASVVNFGLVIQTIRRAVD